MHTLDAASACGMTVTKCLYCDRHYTYISLQTIHAKLRINGILEYERRQIAMQFAAFHILTARRTKRRSMHIGLQLHAARLVYALLGLVDFLEFLFRRTAYVLAKGGHAVGMMLQGELAVGAAHLVVGGRRRNA